MERQGEAMIRDDDWHRRRAKGLGGSDAATVLGISPFKSPLRLWKEKRGEVAPDDLDAKEHIYWGTTLERIIADEYAQRTGRTICEVDTIFVHPKYPFMLCNVDRIVTTRGPRVILEVKNVSTFHFSAAEWGPDGSQQVPPYYYVQAQHNCACTGAVQCDMPILVGGNEYRCYPLPRDDAFIEKMIAKESAFWQSIIDGVEPEPINLSDLKLLFPNHVAGAHVDATEETARAWAMLTENSLQMKRLKAERKDAEFLVKSCMGEAEYLSFNGVRLATWRTSAKTGRRTFRVISSGVGGECAADDDDG